MKTFLIMIFMAIVHCTTIVNAQTVEIDKAKARIAELFKIITYISFDKDNRTVEETRTFIGWGTQKDVFVFDDRIEFRRKKENVIIYYYADLSDINIAISKDQKNNVSVIFENFLINFKGNVNGNLLVDNLNIIRNYHSKERYNSQLVIFKPLAAQYCALKVKSPISEEQRKYIVQANSFSGQKMYDKAIELYKKAIEVDQTAYPAAYSNLALLSAQLIRYEAAIYYMKKYLLLEPEASDARSAQDKIYEWEARVVK